MNKELKSGINENVNNGYFNVYKFLNNLYVSKTLCKQYFIGDENKYKNINGIDCYQIEESDIAYIEEISNIQPIKLKRKYVNVLNTQLNIYFNVYIDKSDNNNFYIFEHLCKQFNIQPKSIKIINNVKYCNITQEDIKQIEILSQNNKIRYKRRYKELNISNNNIQQKKLFMYYYNIDTHESFVDRKTLEQARNNNIEIEGKPIIIEGKNCYSIKKDQLKLYEATSNTHGIERLITNKRKTNIPKQPNKHQTIIVYRDCNTEKLFIPKKYALIHDTERKIIMNKECFEITTSRLESIYNIKFIIVDVYTSEEKIVEITVCEYNDERFISENDLKALNVIVPDSKKIMISNNIYLLVNNEIMETIKNKSSKNTKIKFNFRKITPVKKDN